MDPSPEPGELPEQSMNNNTGRGSGYILIKKKAKFPNFQNL